MGYTNFQNNVTACNDSNLNAMQIGLMQLVFPIGSTYITQDETNPSTILNFGTWERLKGKVCLGLDEDDTTMNTVGKTGGEKTHTLKIEEMPSHSHEINYDVRTEAANFASSNSVGTVAGGTVRETSIKTAPSGGGQAYNNMPPFEVVGYMWIRRA